MVESHPTYKGGGYKAMMGPTRPCRKHAAEAATETTEMEEDGR